MSEGIAAGVEVVQTTRRAAPPRTRMPPHDLTVIVPCYNEERSVRSVLSAVLALPLDTWTIAIDNCSTDGTVEEILRLPLRQVPVSAWPAIHALDQTTPGHRVFEGHRLLVVLRPRTFSKGDSVKLGLELAEGTWVICQDADLEYDPSDIVRLLAHCRRTNAQAVFGARVLPSRRAMIDPFNLGRQALSAAFRVLFASRVTDVATCYKLIRTDVLKSLDLRSAGFDLDFEIAAKLRLAGIDIPEVSVSYAPRSTAAGKKIRWRDGVSALRTLCHVRLSKLGA
jgi:dolichol-phosphate mannosyltransferase